MTTMEIQTHSSNMPPEVRARLHPDFLENEEAYFEMRPELLKSHPNQWVAISNHSIVAYGESLLEVASGSARASGHAYVALVGNEGVQFRVRRQSFAYDHDYHPFALPQVTATFMNFDRTHSAAFTNVIPDTGADLSLLPESDCDRIELFDSPYVPIVSSGVFGPSTASLAYQAFIDIGGQSMNAFVQAVSDGTERILGRDVLNQHRVLFDGPGGMVTFDP